MSGGRKAGRRLPEGSPGTPSPPLRGCPSANIPVMQPRASWDKPQGRRGKGGRGASCPDACRPRHCGQPSVSETGFSHCKRGIRSRQRGSQTWRRWQGPPAPRTRPRTVPSAAASPRETPSRTRGFPVLRASGSVFLGQALRWVRLHCVFISTSHSPLFSPAGFHPQHDTRVSCPPHPTPRGDISALTFPGGALCPVDTPSWKHHGPRASSLWLSSALPTWAVTPAPPSW